MHFKVGDFVEVIEPPFAGYWGILNKDWSLVIGKVFQVTNIGISIDNITIVNLNDSPYSSGVVNGIAGYQWNWPSNCLKRTNIHPVELY